jgi:hypothetical protein
MSECRTEDKNCSKHSGLEVHRYQLHGPTLQGAAAAERLEVVIVNHKAPCCCQWLVNVLRVPIRVIVS